ncbi:MAG TPA: hypothetical protein VM680_00410 [Verrucomicrobiae bacterium]|nr:hypothetical protein [Verrucomicrobiae bacterium]
MKKLVSNAAFIVALTMAAPSAFAITAAQAKAVKKAVTSVPVAEMPATAAELVKNSSNEDREAVAVTAVRAGIYKSRSSARLMVAAVSKAAPEVAGAVTRAASEMEAGQAGMIASAAISAAPSAKTEIVRSANQGVSLSRGSAVTVAATSTSITTPTSSGRIFTSRGSAQTPATATVTQSNSPINTSAGGAGDGTFTGASATPAPAPVAVPYDQPRS